MHVPQEKAGEGHLTSEDSSCIEINMHIEAKTSEQVSNVKGGKYKPVRAGDNQMNTGMGLTMEHADAEMEYVTVRPTQGLVLEERGPCESTSDKGFQLPQNENIHLQPLDPAVAKQVNVTKGNEYHSLQMAISEVDVDKPMNKVASQKAVKHIVSLGESQKPTHQVDLEKHISQGASQGDDDQINPEQANNQVVSLKSINLEEAINQDNAEKTISKAAPQEDVNQIGSINKNDTHNAVNQVKSVTLLGVSQTISSMHHVNSHNKVKQSGTDSLIQVSLQSSTSPLIQEDVGHDFKNIDGKEFITAPDNSNNVSSKTLIENVQPSSKVNNENKGKDNYVENKSNRLPSRIKKLGEVGDIECEKSAPQNVPDIHFATDTGLMSSISNPLLASAAKVRVSSSSPSGVNTFTRIGTKSTYVLPGFSLLTQPRQGVAIRGDPYLNLPPLPHGIGKSENLSAQSETTLTPTLRKYKDYNNPPKKMPPTKERENSQEWPNFADEFDSGTNPEQLVSVYFCQPL